MLVDGTKRHIRVDGSMDLENSHPTSMALPYDALGHQPSQVPASEQDSSRFFHLPLELRENVYRSIFRGIVVKPARLSKPTRAFIFLACRSCYNEARPIFLQTACFSLADASTSYKPETQKEMQRMIGSQFQFIHHVRTPLPYSYESWSDDLTIPYVQLKTLTVVVGLSHIGSQRLPSEPTSAESMFETIDGRYMKDFTEANFENDHVLMWTPPESFVYNYIRRRDKLGGKYRVYVHSGPDVLSELEREDSSYKQELSFLRLCSFEETEPTLSQCLYSELLETPSRHGTSR